MTNLEELSFRENPLSGELPNTLTKLQKMQLFYIDHTCLVEPQDDAFQAWLASIQFYRGNDIPHPECCGTPGVEVPIPIPIPDACPVLSSSSCNQQEDFNGDGTIDCLLSEFEDDETNTMQLWCMQTRRPPPLTPFFWYGLFHISQGGSAKLAGKCPFEGGRNAGILYHSGDNDGSGKPDCLIRTKWTSIDGGLYDDDNDGNLDWWVYKYDVDSGTATSMNYESPYGSRVSELLSRANNHAVRVGPSFNDLPPVLDIESIPEGQPMNGEDRAWCDLDRDGDCDAVDVEVFDQAYGKCAGEMGYIPDADFNGDGCVALSDRLYLFPNRIYLPNLVTGASSGW